MDLATAPSADLLWITEESKLFYREGAPLYGITEGRYLTVEEAKQAGYRESRIREDTARGIAEHSKLKRFRQLDRGKMLGEGWKLLFVDENISAPGEPVKRPDAVYVKDPQGPGERGRVVVVDDFFGEVESIGHIRKGWSYRVGKSVKDFLDLGYEYGYVAAMIKRRQ